MNQITVTSLRRTKQTLATPSKQTLAPSMLPLRALPPRTNNRRKEPRRRRGKERERTVKAMTQAAPTLPRANTSSRAPAAEVT